MKRHMQNQYKRNVAWKDICKTSIRKMCYKKIYVKPGKKKEIGPEKTYAKLT